jgi:hypothetical protein
MPFLLWTEEQAEDREAVDDRRQKAASALVNASDMG